MDFSKEEVDKVLERKMKDKKMKKSASYMSMENLDQEDETPLSDRDEEPEESKHGSSLMEQETVTIEPTYILHKAYERLTAVGSSTALIAVRNNKNICIANLGDSGFMLVRIRNGEAYAARRSHEQQHSFNIPYQLSILPGEKEFAILKQKGRIEELKKLRAILRPKSDSDMC